MSKLSTVEASKAPCTLEECCVCGDESNLFTQKCGHIQCQACYTKGLCFGHKRCPICRKELIPEFEEILEPTPIPMCCSNIFFASVGNNCEPLVNQQCTCAPAPYHTFVNLMRMDGMEEHDIPTEYDYTVECLRRMRRGFRIFRRFLKDEYDLEWKPKIPNNGCNPHCHNSCHSSNLDKAYRIYKDIINFTTYAKCHIKQRAVKRQRTK